MVIQTRGNYSNVQYFTSYFTCEVILGFTVSTYKF